MSTVHAGQFVQECRKGVSRALRVRRVYYRSNLKVLDSRITSVLLSVHRGLGGTELLKRILHHRVVVLQYCTVAVCGFSIV